MISAGGYEYAEGSIELRPLLYLNDGNGHFSIDESFDSKQDVVINEAQKHIFKDVYYRHLISMLMVE